MLGVRMRLMHKPLKLVSVNENIHIRSQRLIVLLENKAIRHFRTYMDMEKEGRLEVGAGSEGRLTGRGRGSRRMGKVSGGTGLCSLLYVWLTQERVT